LSQFLKANRKWSLFVEIRRPKGYKGMSTRSSCSTCSCNGGSNNRGGTSSSPLLSATHLRTRLVAVACDPKDSRAESRSSGWNSRRGVGAEGSRQKRPVRFSRSPFETWAYVLSSGYQSPKTIALPVLLTSLVFIRLVPEPGPTGCALEVGARPNGVLPPGSGKTR
jgi:hypothetical protein